MSGLAGVALVAGLWIVLGLAFWTWFVASRLRFHVEPVPVDRHVPVLNRGRYSVRRGRPGGVIILDLDAARELGRSLAEQVN